MTAPDTFGLTGADYQAVEMSITQYFNNSGKVDVRDSEAARAKLDREQVLRIENGDSAANRLLATEHLADVIVHITASPTTQSAYGRAVRLNAKAVGTTDGRLLGVCSLDLPLPLTRPIINDFTRHMTEELMKQMAIKWAVGPEYDPIEVRIYKAASIDDSSKIATWIKKAPGVTKVDLAQATGGSATSYAVVKVAFNGSPWALYEEIKDSVGQSQGLKAVDLQNNTINLEISGPMNLVDHDAGGGDDHHHGNARDGTAEGGADQSGAGTAAVRWLRCGPTPSSACRYQKSFAADEGVGATLETCI